MNRINYKSIKKTQSAIRQTQSASILSNQVTVFRFLLGSFAVLAFLYILLLGNMVFDIVARRGLESDAQILANEVRDLELSYLAMSHTVDLDLAYTLGFRETETTFITRRNQKTLGLGSVTGAPVESFGLVQNGI